jgi:hypothetical protein
LVFFAFTNKKNHRNSRIWLKIFSKVCGSTIHYYRFSMIELWKNITATNVWAKNNFISVRYSQRFQQIFALNKW